jgi:hypothetical protein
LKQAAIPAELLEALENWIALYQSWKEEGRLNDPEQRLEQENNSMNKLSALLISIFIIMMSACNAGGPPITEETKPEPEANPICASVTEIPGAECEALVAFYNSTDGPNWLLKRGWLETAQPCDWTGVECEAGHVTALMLNYNDLQGSLPPEIGQLSKLKTMSLYFNYLNGSLPVELGRLSELEILILHSNRLEGNLPPELGQLTRLKELDLDSNKLTGSIPPQFGQMASLEKLNLNNNDLSGPIPAELGNLSELRGLFLAGNKLSGAIPAELGNLANLWMFNVDYNALQGEAPGRLQELPGSGYDFLKWKKEQPTN